MHLIKKFIKYKGRLTKIIADKRISAEEERICWEFIEKQRRSWPTREEAIRVIVSQFTDSQLKKLELIGSSGRVVTFERQLFLKYSCLHPTLTAQEIASTIKDSLDKNHYLFDLPNPRIIYAFFKDICDSFFSKNI